ncbi:hypothetical protein BDF14DRAFT_1872752 [Spinellus fusiger]|nr:hypothetical protein BDF14DRAFT_1872752 [Spinellus fusiger]
MFKDLIHTIIRKTLDQKTEEEANAITCKDCGEKGHYTKCHHLYKKYISTSQQVSTSGKRKTFTDKPDSTRLKKQARQLADKKEAPIARCSSCRTKGHNTSRSPLCPHRKQTKIQQVSDLLGKHI